MPDDFDYNPSTGKSGDRSHRTEIKRSCVEYIAPSDYMVCFLIGGGGGGGIELSYYHNTFGRSDLLNLVCSTF